MSLAIITTFDEHVLRDLPGFLLYAEVPHDVAHPGINLPLLVLRDRVYIAPHYLR